MNVWAGGVWVGRCGDVGVWVVGVVVIRDT